MTGPLRRVAPGQTRTPKPGQAGESAGRRRVPGRPRSERADQAILEATLQLLDEGVPLDALSVEAVAARAEVGKATVYRRWPNKFAMVEAALNALRDTPPQVAGRSVREDLTLVLDDLMRWAADSVSARVLPHLLSGMQSAPAIRDEYYRVVLQPRISVLRAVLQQGVQRRELIEDLNIDLAVTALVGPAMASLMLPPCADVVLHGPIALAEHIVDLFLRGGGNRLLAAVPR